MAWKDKILVNELRLIWTNSIICKMGLLAVAESSVSIILSFDITKCNKLLTGPFPKYIYILLQTYIGHCGKNSPGEQFVVFWQRVYQKTHAAFSHVIFFSLWYIQDQYLKCSPSSEKKDESPVGCIVLYVYLFIHFISDAFYILTTSTIITY